MLDMTSQRELSGLQQSIRILTLKHTLPASLAYWRTSPDWSEPGPQQLHPVLHAHAGHSLTARQQALCQIVKVPSEHS